MNYNIIITHSIMYSCFKAACLALKSTAVRARPGGTEDVKQPIIHSNHKTKLVQEALSKKGTAARPK